MSLALPEGRSQHVAELNAVVTTDSVVISPDGLSRFMVLGQVSERTNLSDLKERRTNRCRLNLSEDREMKILGRVRQATEMEKNVQITEEKFVCLRYWKILLLFNSTGFWQSYITGTVFWKMGLFPSSGGNVGLDILNEVRQKSLLRVWTKSYQLSCLCTQRCFQNNRR
jgi:hypothetical protein